MMNYTKPITRVCAVKGEQHILTGSQASAPSSSDNPSDVEVLNSIEEKKIAVLGMKESGKTQFLRTLQKKPYKTYVQTAQSEYERIEVKLSAGKKLIIKSGMDIGGADFFAQHYKQLSKGADAVFFIFDLIKFKEDEEYRLQTRARLQFIGEELDIPENHQTVIGSHVDLFAGEEQKIEGHQYAIDYLKDVYKPIFQNFFMCDLRDYRQVVNICKKKLS